MKRIPWTPRSFSLTPSRSLVSTVIALVAIGMAAGTAEIDVGATGTTPEFSNAPNPGIAPLSQDTPGSGIAVRTQDATGLEFHYAIGSFTLEPVLIDGETFQRLSLPGAFLPNKTGAPDLPSTGRCVALPQGATATVEITGARTWVYHDIRIAPAPAMSLEDDGTLPIYSKDPSIYREDPSIYDRDALYPASPAVLLEPGKMRGIDVVTLGLTPFQYNPVTRELTVYLELEISITFHGGTGKFGEDRLRSRYWEPILQNHILNYASLPRIDFSMPRGDRDGYEYVIITADNPSFVAWADTLRNWRKLQGISTEVFTTTDIGGSSAADIEDWLDNAYNSWDIPPAAFLILGDYPGSGEGGSRDYGIAAPIWEGYCVSDNMYADVDGDNLPDMAHGRITAQNASQLETMIGKLLSYEREPYTDPGFYDHPVLSGCWDQMTWYILCTEVIFGFQANVLGKHPVREYVSCAGYPGNYWSSAPGTEIWVNYFGPEGLGYIPATPSYLTDWGGTAYRINADINAGAYFVLHRDHGMAIGWGEPSYTIPDLAGLHNDMYPFVFSPDCLTGKYNWANNCFTEAFHRMGHGALGLVAPAELTHSFLTEIFVWGMFDGLWPEFMPDYGSDGSDNLGTSDLRTAFAHIYGKYYLWMISWPYSNPHHSIVTYHIFHHHGDAFLTLYSEVPQALDVVHDQISLTNTSFFTIQANEDAVIALTVDGEIIGVADATGEPQNVPIIPQADPGVLRITVTKANYLRYDVQIPILPESDVAQRRVGVPGGLRLEAGTPNPFSRTTIMRYHLEQSGHVSLEVFDASGRLVRHLLSTCAEAGSGSVEWNGRDDAGLRVGAGTYFCRMSVEGGVVTQRVIVME